MWVSWLRVVWVPGLLADGTLGYGSVAPSDTGNEGPWAAASVGPWVADTVRLQ